jgi:hypothetical protein
MNASDEGGFATLEEILEAMERLEAGEDAGEGMEIIRLRCPSAFHGEVINGRFLKVPCRGTRCKIPGKRHTDHVIDLHTGRFRTVGDERGYGNGIR